MRLIDWALPLTRRQLETGLMRHRSHAGPGVIRDAVHETRMLRRVFVVADGRACQFGGAPNQGGSKHGDGTTE